MKRESGEVLQFKVRASGAKAAGTGGKVLSAFDARGEECSAFRKGASREKEKVPPPQILEFSASCSA